jgi:hypothetical protein
LTSAKIAASERWSGPVQILTRFRHSSTLTALGLIAESGRFAHPRELAAWLGIAPASTPPAISSTAATSPRPATATPAGC